MISAVSGVERRCGFIYLYLLFIRRPLQVKCLDKRFVYAQIWFTQIDCNRLNSVLKLNPDRSRQTAVNAIDYFEGLTNVN